VSLSFARWNMSALRLTDCSEFAGRVAVYYKQIAAGRREATIFGSSIVIDVVIADRSQITTGSPATSASRNSARPSGPAKLQVIE
jgi:hypothetical protein